MTLNKPKIGNVESILYGNNMELWEVNIIELQLFTCIDKLLFEHHKYCLNILIDDHNPMCS